MTRIQKDIHIHTYDAHTKTHTHTYDAHAKTHTHTYTLTCKHLTCIESTADGQHNGSLWRGVRCGFRGSTVQQHNIRRSKIFFLFFEKLQERAHVQPSCILLMLCSSSWVCCRKFECQRSITIRCVLFSNLNVRLHTYAYIYICTYTSLHFNTQKILDSQVSSVFVEI